MVLYGLEYISPFCDIVRVELERLSENDLCPAVTCFNYRIRTVLHISSLKCIASSARDVACYKCHRCVSRKFAEVDRIPQIEVRAYIVFAYVCFHLGRHSKTCDLHVRSLILKNFCRCVDTNGWGYMMKLLIVDDEMLTRNGLVSSIAWEDLGIDEVYEASDGIEGLKMAELHHPEIILSDVRMPRMSGIDMLYKVREHTPDTVFIFMSGYSDKEYLKAAIKLRAVNYVEKPLDLTEIEQAVRTAAERHIQIVESRRSQDLRFNMYAPRLAMSLTHPWKLTESENEQLAAQYCEKYGDADVFHAAFSAIVQAPGALELPLDYLQTTEKQLHDMVRPLHLHVISVAKKTNLFVFHFFRRTDITPQLLHSVESYLMNIFSPVRNFHFAVGAPVCGIRKIYDSYSAAVIALQSTFFFEPGTCLDPERLSGLTGPELPEQASHQPLLPAPLSEPERG